MTLVSYLPIVFIYAFGVLNLVGIRPDLVSTSLIHAALGVVIFLAIRFLQMQLHFFRNNATFFYIFFTLILIVTLFFGMEVNGSRRWIDLGLFPLQTSEIFKVFFIVFMASIFSKVRFQIDAQNLFFKGLALTVIPFILILRQPDLGSALVVGALFMVMAIHSSIPRKQILSFFGFIILMIPIIWFMLHDYQQKRIISFLDPQHDTSGASYNIVQASIAIGSGQIVGKGLGMGKQSQLSFLPEYHTDFAFSSLIEQFGFVGGFILVVLYFWFFANLFYSMFHYLGRDDPNDKYAFYYLLGFSVMFISQSAINIGMNLGLLPVAGITLPFVSYGGSSLITFLIAMALIPRR